MSTTKTTTQPIGVKDIAAKLNCEPRELRAFIRTLDLGVGRGAKYQWDTLADPTVKRVMREWNKAHAASKEA